MLAALVQEFPERDASGTRVDANERYGTIRKEMAKRLPGGTSRGKTEIRAQVKILKSVDKGEKSASKQQAKEAAAAVTEVDQC